MACDHLEKVDPRVRRTRKLLQDALAELMREREYASISVQDVTERATVNRATFYAHYTDKQTLLEALVQANFRDFVHGRFKELPDMTRESLTAMFSAILEFVDQSVRVCPKSASGLDRILVTALHEEVPAMFRGWMAHKPDHPFRRHKEEVAAVVLANTVLGAACHWSKGKRKVKPQALAEKLVAMLAPSAPVGTPA